MTLLTAAQLTEWLHYDVEIEDVSLVERVVTGWLRDAGLTDEDLQADDPQIFSWVIELAGIAYENPTSMTSDTSLDIGSQWDRARRAEILERAAAWALVKHPAPAAGGLLPQGAFPPAVPYPDSYRQPSLSRPWWRAENW